MPSSIAQMVVQTQVASFTGSASDVSLPAVNTAAVVTYTAVVGRKHHLYRVFGSYNAAPIGLLV